MGQAQMIYDYYQRLEAENRKLRKVVAVLLVGGTLTWLALLFT